MQSGKYTTRSETPDRMAALEIKLNCTDSKVVHVPLWYAAILHLVAPSFDFSEINGLFELKFHMEYSVEKIT